MKYENFLKSTVSPEFREIIDFLELDENRTTEEIKEGKDLFIFDINGDLTEFKINYIKTLKEYQGKKIAPEAMRKIMSFADENDMSISLFSDEKLHKFYEKLGFKLFHGSFYYGPIVKTYENEHMNNKVTETNKNIFICFVQTIKNLFH